MPLQQMIGAAEENQRQHAWAEGLTGDGRTAVYGTEVASLRVAVLFYTLWRWGCVRASGSFEAEEELELVANWRAAVGPSQANRSLAH